ncbi:hypothetical protein [uncultured Flavobacterium sp.]|uniref:hypothetical protein n=1 Tax=uncultured Flavobacterium sp. TaxID=165435 RepID=UPI0029304628|nr:hypothetical protein [uncultured Flavobacterium sp.]
MKFAIRTLLLSIFDFLIIWLWVNQMNPDPSVSIGILILVPFVIILNLIIALILFFTYRKFTSLFLINSIIAGILMYYLFIKGIDRYQNEKLESWEFYLQDTTYVITHWKIEKTFSIIESTNPGSSDVFLEGKFIEKDESYLTTDSTKYKIKNGYLFGFRNVTDSIKLTKIER